MKHSLRAAGLAALLLGVAACGQHGLDHKLVFYDQTDTDYEAAQFQPIAAGASIHIKVSDVDQGGVTKLSDVSSSQSAVLSVASFQNDIFTLQAGKPGTSRITASTGTTKDAIDLDVHAIASSQLYVPEDIGHGFAMVPGGQVQFDLFHYDTAGEMLTGFGAVPVSATPPSALVQQPDSDRFGLVAPSAIGTTIDLQAGKLQHSVAVVDPASVASIELVTPRFCSNDPTQHDAKLPASFSVQFPGQPFVEAYGVAAHLADGRYVFGACSDLALQPDSAATGLVDLYATNVVPCVNLGATSQWTAGGDRRELDVEFMKPGSATFTATCFGKKATYTVTIEP